MLPEASALFSRLPERLRRWVPQLLAAELCFGIDSALLAAILDRESLGGDALSPKGPAGTGDRGFGLGLAQVDARFHHPFAVATFDDLKTPLWTDPTFNILYAARLLRKNFDAAKGDVAVAVAAYNAGLYRVRLAVAKLPPDAPLSARVAAVDKVTTGGDYVANVLERRAKFSGEPVA